MTSASALANRSAGRTDLAPVDVLYVEMSRSPSYGGTKRVASNLAAALDPARFRPHVLFYRDGPWVRDVERHGIPTVILPPSLASPEGANPRDSAWARAIERTRWIGVTPSGQDPSAFHPWRRGASDLLSWGHLLGRDAARARRLRPWVPASTRLIHVNHSMVSDFSWLHVARWLGVPFLAHEHGIWKPRPAAWRVVAERAASILCLTEARVGELKALIGERVRADFLPNGVPVEALVPARDRASVRADLGISTETPVLITAGHLQAWKGQRLAVEAAAILSGHEMDFVWLLAGAELELEYARALRQRILEAGLDRRVRLLGERTDLPELFAASDLAVHTSIQPEPFGLVVLEAMLQACPVVGPREGGIPAMIEDGVHGRLVRPRDPEAIAVAVGELLRDPDRRRAMGVAARARVRQCYDVRLQARRVETIYARALAQSEAARR